jgi:glycosyltransferase involved in cell wall biosynthesis
MKLRVFLLSQEEIDEPDMLPPLDEHYEWVIVPQTAISTFTKLSRLIRKYHPVVFCTIGDKTFWNEINNLPYEYSKKRIHFEKLSDVTSGAIEDCYINSITDNRFSPSQPLFSVISTTFHSDKKIFRPYESLKAQTYRNWEWILWDDSKEDHQDIWNKLKEFQDEDIRIKCYRDTHHSGYIGDMKWKSSSLSKGEWIVELDHDDIIPPDLFEQCLKGIEKYPDADFIFTNCIELYEGEDEKPHAYSDFYGFGYGAYQKEWIRGKWHNVSLNPHLTPHTIRYIIGVPNHIRIWRRSFYEKIGRHNPELPVVDDYELLIRSFLAGKWLHINYCGYYQYRNEGGNNFTFLRNALIQYLTRSMAKKYEPQINKCWRDKGIYDDCAGGIAHNTQEAWVRNDGIFRYDKNTYVYTPYVDKEKTVSVVMTLQDESAEDIVKSVKSVIAQDHLWRLNIVGEKSPNLENAMNIIRAEYPDDVIKKVLWWNLSDRRGTQIALNYAHRMMIFTDWCAYIKPGTTWEPTRLSTMMQNVSADPAENRMMYVEDLANGAEPILFNVLHHYDLLKRSMEFSDSTIKKYIRS